jgi:hypothetical protein
MVDAGVDGHKAILAIKHMKTIKRSLSISVFNKRDFEGVDED